MLQLGRCARFLIKVCEDELPKIDFYTDADIEPRPLDLEEIDHKFNILIQEAYHENKSIQEILESQSVALSLGERCSRS